uniref:Variant surface glycoprotein 1125.2949 n=1 Tax=Trypanosoma brucei TaxID=5691 RepID=A0A1J0R919_9TRYP|nr:variant surface glycoprotein 1125.2949 [Trypanosoma brucei]
MRWHRQSRREPRTQAAAVPGQKSKRVFVAGAILGTSLVVPEAADAAVAESGDGTQEKITTACQEAAFAETVAWTYEQIANQQQHAVQDLRKQAANWRLTAAAEPDQQSAHLLSALPAYAEAQSAKARSAIKLTTQELSAAAKAYHARAHFLYGAQEQAAVTWNTETNGYKKVSSTTFKARTGAPKPGTSKCDDNSRKIGSTIPTTMAFGTNNLKKIAYSTPEQIAKLTPRTVLTITGGATCSTDDTNSWGATVACCNGITATPTYDHEQEAATGPTAV